MDPYRALQRQRQVQPLSPSARARMKRLAQRDGGVFCVYCGRRAPFEELVLDHVVPRSRGGPDGDHNRVLACPSCDRAKRNRVPQEWCPGKTWGVPVLDNCPPAPIAGRREHKPLPDRQVQPVASVAEILSRPNLRAVPEAFKTIAWCELCCSVVGDSHACAGF